MFAHEQQCDSIEHAQQLSRTRYFWWVNYLTDYTAWDFLWEPPPWQSDQRHIWPSQWQADSGTSLVPAAGYTDTNYHTDTQLTRVAGSVPVYIIDHTCGHAESVRAQVAEFDELSAVTLVRYADSYLATLKRIARSATTENVWIVSSVGDYEHFDFSWHPDAFQQTLLHVFASDDLKFGDTFFMHVPTFRDKIFAFDHLEQYDLNFVGITVPRRPPPVVQHPWDTLVLAVKRTDFPGPVAVFTCGDYTVGSVPPVNLWSSSTQAIVPLSSGAGACVVPRLAAPYIRTQLYDYPRIDRSKRHMLTDPSLDIVFIDSGEPGADDNYKLLHYYTSSRLNQLRRSSGVTGRVAAYQAAAELSRTPWFFAVFAKLRVDGNFNWSWQPDRLQEPKHYIFHARNPANGLEYGHQAVIAYNRELVLNNPGSGLDFTLDSPHEVVPVLSGTANYCTDPWTAWRTAFRECIKLNNNTDVESAYRLKQWLNPNHGGNTHAEWSRIGAEDAVEYYSAVGGDFAELRKSYDWTWLASYALLRRNLTPSQ